MALPARSLPRLSEREALRYEAAAELKIRCCRHDALHFIQEYVYIEDRSEGSPKFILFRLWPAQVKVLAKMLVERLLLICKARQLGLTWLCLAYALWRMLYTPGYKVLGFSKKYEYARVNLQNRLVDMLRRLPKWMVRERLKRSGWQGFAGSSWETVGDEVRVHHPQAAGSIDPTVSVFTIQATTEEGGRSFTADLILLDEFAFAEQPAELWSSAKAVIDQPGSSQQAFVCSTNQRGSHFDALCGDAHKGRGPFAKGWVFLAWFAHPKRDQTWRLRAEQEDPLFHHREYPATFEESRMAGQGTFFQKFSYEIHVVRPFVIPDWWPRWLANDPGYSDPFFWLWLTSDNDGNIYAYQEYTRESGQKERVSYAKQAAAVAGLCAKTDREGNPLRDDEGNVLYHSFDFLVTGHDAAEKDQAEQSLVDRYEAAFRAAGFEVGIVCTQPNRARRARIMVEDIEPYEDANTSRTVARLRIFDTCTHLIEALPTMVCDEHEPEKYADHPADHGPDCLGYGLQQWHPEDAEEPQRPKAPVEMDKDALVERSRMATLRGRFA